jgi:hypothetical protein
MPAPGCKHIGATIVAALLFSAGAAAAQGAKAGLGVAVNASRAAAIGTSQSPGNGMFVKGGYAVVTRSTTGQVVTPRTLPSSSGLRATWFTAKATPSATRAATPPQRIVRPGVSGVTAASVARDVPAPAQHSTAELKWKKGGIMPVAPPRDVPGLAVPVSRPDPVPDPERPHLPIHDGPGIHPFIPGLTPQVLLFSPAFITGPDRECPGQKSRHEKRRAPWGLGWLYGYGRDMDIERTGVSPFSHYLRTPLLSGLYDRRSNACPRPEPDTCAALTLRTADGPITREVALPQAEARTAKELRARMLETLADGESFTLLTMQGEEFEIQPGSVEEIEAKSCRT